MLLSIWAVAARAAAAASGALAMLYCAVTLPAIRNTLYKTGSTAGGIVGVEV